MELQAKVAVLEEQVRAVVKELQQQDARLLAHRAVIDKVAGDLHDHPKMSSLLIATVT